MEDENLCSSITSKEDEGLIERLIYGNVDMDLDGNTKPDKVVLVSPKGVLKEVKLEPKESPSAEEYLAESLRLDALKAPLKDFTKFKIPRLNPFSQNNTGSEINLFSSTLTSGGTKRLRTNSSPDLEESRKSRKNIFDFVNTEFSQPEYRLCGNCKKMHCVFCIEEVPKRKFGEYFCECSTDTCLWKNAGICEARFGTLTSKYGIMSFQKQGSPESPASSHKNMDTQTEYVIQEHTSSSKNDNLSFEEKTGQIEGRFKIGTSEPPDFWRCLCKLHIIPRPKKDEVTLTAKGTDPLYTGINKKEGLFDFPESSYKYIGSKPSPVEGRVRSSSTSSSHRSNNEGYVNKIKALERKVQELENRNSNYTNYGNNNTGLSTQNNPPQDNRISMNRSYYENRAAQYEANKKSSRGGETSRNNFQGRRGGGRYPYRGGRGRGNERGSEHGEDRTGGNNQ